MAHQHRLSEFHCPYCGKRMNGATEEGDTGAPPRDGDIALCIDCSSIGIFDGAGMRKPTDAEIVEIAGYPEIVSGMKVIADYHEFMRFLNGKIS